MESYLGGEEVVYIFIEKSNEIYLVIYQIALNFMNPQTYNLDSNVLIELIKDNYLDLTKSLVIFSFMHDAYLTEYLKGLDNGRQK